MILFLLLGQPSNRKHYTVKDRPARKDFVFEGIMIKKAPLSNTERCF